MARNGKIVLIDEDTRRLLSVCDDRVEYEKMGKKFGFGYVVHFLIHKALGFHPPLTPKQRQALGGKFKGAPLEAKLSGRQSEYSRLGLSEDQKGIFEKMDNKILESTKKAAAKKAAAKILESTKKAAAKKAAAKKSAAKEKV
jgi:hypothetical protein